MTKVVKNTNKHQTFLSPSSKKRKLDEKGNEFGGKTVTVNSKNTSRSVRKKVKAHGKLATAPTKTSSKPILSEKNVVQLKKKYETLMGQVESTPIKKYVSAVLNNFDIIRKGQNELINKLEELANVYEPIRLNGTQAQPIRNCIKLLKEMEKMDPFAISIGDAIKFADDVKKALDDIRYSSKLSLTDNFKGELSKLIDGVDSIVISLKNLDPQNIKNQITKKGKELDKNSRLVRELAIWGAVLTIGGILATAAVIVAGVLVNPLILIALEGSIAMLAGGCTCIGFAIGTNDRKEIEKELDDLNKHQEALDLFLYGLKNFSEKTNVLQKPEILKDENSLLGIKEPSEKEKQRIAAENFLKHFNEGMASLKNK